ncbi:MAG TPA: hypothetical protein PK112_00410 [candidate division Zixibacteria bacterium]|mgnify:FL=1|nr:hypothetical protein [candidate division Zixibacteria bacterium]
MTKSRTDEFRPIDPAIIERVDELNEEVKVLALNLAIYLARAKGRSATLSRLEPDFIKLVNGTVKVVHELADIINAARNLEAMVNDLATRPPGSDPIEGRLRAILEQCTRIMDALAEEGRVNTKG